MSSLFPAMKKISEQAAAGGGAKEINWHAFEEEFTQNVKKAKENCELCKDIDWQDQDELNICKACGAVTERPLDMGAEYRFFSADDRMGGDPCRVGPPIDPLEVVDTQQQEVKCSVFVGFTLGLCFLIRSVLCLWCSNKCL